MRQDQLDGLVVFLAVAQTNGFSSAGVQLGISPSAVSQSIRQLERRLGFTLFHRTTRSVSLTDVGARYLERVAPAVHQLTQAAADLDDENSPPSGTLKINLPRSASLIVLQPILPGFLARYPDVRVELTLDNALVDIVAPGYDAGIRFGNLVEMDMVGIPVGPRLSAHVLASPAYLARRGEVSHPRQLLDHECLLYKNASSGMIDRWEFAKGGDAFELEPKGQLVVNDASTLVQAALDGLGIVYMINGYVEPLIAAGRLVRLLPDWSPEMPSFTLYYPDRNRASRPLRALIHCLQAARETHSPVENPLMS